MNMPKETAKNKREYTLNCCEKLLNYAAFVVVGALGVLLTYKLFQVLFSLLSFLFG